MKGDGRDPVALIADSREEPATLMDRRTFDSHIARGEEDECWPWSGATQHGGYGCLNENDRQIRAHRRAWQYANGAIPAGMQVLHRCDNPPCCNHAHLFLGTHADNMRDMFAKGRRTAALGESNGKSVLTEDQVREIKRTYKGRRGERKELLAKYGIAKGTLQAIMEGKTWRHVS